jgi:hypothetical protein
VNAPASAYTVIVFAADERFWLPENRRNQSATPDAQGRFTFANLPAGTYRLAAVDDFDAVAGVHAGLLRQVAPASTNLITLAEGERKTQDLKVR